ncbi:MAG TPA: hypothetical protein VLE70_12510 [Anaerolineae bacterium]|jgi:hypothetical protein|nr:hypothetical protein [Anaerolineae bacterium]
MSKNEQDEKDMGKRDQQDEKELSKQEEKSVEEKWERDPLAALVWALILIWAGVVLLAGNLGAFDLMSEFAERLPFGGGADLPIEVDFFPMEAWSVFWLGAAAILLLEVAIRVLVPAYRRSVVGTLILAGVFIGLGLGTWNCVWPLILIGIGLSIILRGFQRNGKKGE